jgi:hypothetical protein
MTEILKLINSCPVFLDHYTTTVPGMTKFVRSGKYLGVVPLGFDHYGTKVKDFSRRAVEQKIVINETGKKLRIAWDMKIQGYRDFEIRTKLKELGVDISLQKLSAMWRRPFYCGVQTNALVGKDPVMGNWEPLVSKETFLKVKDILEANHHGYTINKDVPMRPLVGTLKCPHCGKKLCGYEGKGKRNYYKCQRCNKVSLNAETSKRQKDRTGAHDLFVQKLDEFILNPRYLNGFQIQMRKFIESSSKNQKEEVTQYRNQLTSLQKKLDNLQGKYYLDNEPPKDIYEKLLKKIETEMAGLREKFPTPEVDISNLGENLALAMEFSENASKYWESASLRGKRVIQELVFPDGLVVDPENRQYLTSKVNALFAAKACYISVIEEQKKEIPVKNDEDSVVVAGAGFEPTTFGL